MNNDEREGGLKPPAGAPQPVSMPYRKNAVYPDTGSALAGFFIGLFLIVASSALSALIIYMAASNASDIPADFTSLAVLAALGLPLTVATGAIIWCMAKGKNKVAYGIIASIITAVISLPILLVAACFGMIN
ncbi:MAG: hypothetical protein ACREO1_06250 [Arenimonas sp.]